MRALLFFGPIIAGLLLTLLLVLLYSARRRAAVREVEVSGVELRDGMWCATVTDIYGRRHAYYSPLITRSDPRHHDVRWFDESGQRASAWLQSMLNDHRAEVLYADSHRAFLRRQHLNQPIHDDLFHDDHS